MDFSYDDPIIYDKRKGTADSPYVSFNESLIVDTSAKVTLTEIPDKFHGVIVKGLSQTWYEVQGGDIGTYQYKVDYPNRTVTVNSAHVGKQLTFEFKGKGNTFVPVSSIYTERDGMKVTETLQELADSAGFVADAMEGILEELPANKELRDLKVAKDGTTYPTAKDRLDAENDKIVNFVEDIESDVDQFKTQTNSQLADIVINADTFKMEIPEANDNGRLQRAIDYASSTLGEFDKKIKVNLGNHVYDITGLIVPRGISLGGNATLKLHGVGNTALKYRSLHSTSSGFKISLEDEGQTGIDLDSVAGASATQFNSFFNVWVEGNGLKDTTSVKIGETWTNSFFSCYFLRCADGLVFNHVDSNANFFYGCEIRHSKGHSNSKMAILHLDGKNNAFIGGVIETYQDGIDVRGGTLTIDNAYTEDFQVDRPFRISGDGVLNFKDSLIKGKFRVAGGKALRINGCDLSRGGVPTNNNSPLVRFESDVGTEVTTKDNVIPDDLIHARWGLWFDRSSSLWRERSPQNKKEMYLDRDNVYVARVSEYKDATGDGSRAVVPFDALINPYDELDISEFTPISDGLFSIKVNVRLEGLNDTFGTCTMYLREKGGEGREFTLDSQHARSRDGNGRMTLKGIVDIDIKNLHSCDFLIRVEGGSKTVGIMGSTSTSVQGNLSIERIS